MYWLVGVLIVTAMIGALAVASSIGLPALPLLVSLVTVSIGPLLLIVITVILAVISQRRIPLSSSATHHQSFHQHFDQNFFQDLPQNPHLIFSFSVSLTRYLMIMGLAAVLIIGSALQALIAHQQAETTAIYKPMRVQALVTIEGLSDSVYNPETNSGYQQVAVIEQIAPLVSELTAEDLNNATINYLENINNSPSIDELNNSNVFNSAIIESDLTSNKSTIHKPSYDKNIEYRVLLNAYPKKPSKNATKDSQIATLNDLQPGDQLFMTLTLASLETSQEAINNPSGFDSYRWLRSRHIDGVATILAVGKPITTLSDQLRLTTASDSYFKGMRTAINQWRWQLRQHFYQDWSQQTTAQQQAKAVTLSLLTGDRSLINRDTKDLYQLAGISHLLAISGTHILFLAIMLAGATTLLIDRLCPRLYSHIPRWQVRWWVMISAAFIYALFTGFDVPAARTAWMLLAVGVVRLTLLPMSTMRVLLALAVLMAWVDPYVLWQAGYWLSFIAVALILKYDSKRHTPNKIVVNNRQNILSRTNKPKFSAFVSQIGQGFKRLFKLQCWLFIALLPVTLLLFGKVSLWGLVINLFAIGLFGWVIVPLNLLAGLCYLLLPAVADSIWSLVSAIVAGLHGLIAWLTALPSLEGAWLHTPVNTGILLIALLSMLPWLLPRGLISRWLALPPLTLLVMTIVTNQQALSLTPTLYVLPTGDRYLSAAVLQYPIYENGRDDSVSWLFLADHRGRETRTMPSSLTADTLSATLEQQLRTLSIKALTGVVVQTSSIISTATPAIKDRLDDKSYNTDNQAKANPSELLAMTVRQLSKRLPTSHYWQAGRSESRSTSTQVSGKTDQPKNNANISAQRCEQGKKWQLTNSNLALQVMTGWPEIKDASVWDCTVAIDSDLPIKTVQYDPTDPQRSPQIVGTQILSLTATATSNSAAIDTTLKVESQKNSPQRNAPQKINHTISTQKRIILDAATHQRVWQLEALLCLAKPKLTDVTLNRSVTWLGHSASNISTEALTVQGVSAVMTYNQEPLEVALALGPDLGTESRID